MTYTAATFIRSYCCDFFLILLEREAHLDCNFGSIGLYRHNFSLTHFWHGEVFEFILLFNQYFGWIITLKVIIIQAHFLFTPNYSITDLFLS